MKKFETPEIELVKFEAMDVVTTSDEVFEEPSPEEYCI
jgi:hypothetical protein